MNRILITGAAGFIGAHLFKSLKSQGYDVYGIDNLNAYYDPDFKVDRINAFDIDVRYCDITDVEKISRVFLEIKPDIVIHLAAMAGVRYSVESPRIYHKVNIEGTQNIIDMCRSYKVKKVIYASTSSVCGGVEELPWREDMSLNHQISPYAYTKWVNECQFKMSGLNNVGLRFFTVYGPWGRPDMALFNFTRDILEDNTISLYNNGQMKRDFTYIDDIIDGVEIVLKADTDTNEIYNIGNTTQVDLHDFVKAIEKNLNKKAVIEYLPLQKGDCVETWSDVTKLSNLGYNPKIGIEEGVKNFVDWYREYHDRK